MKKLTNLKKLSTYKWLDNRWNIKQDVECKLNFEDRKTVIEVATLVHRNSFCFESQLFIGTEMMEKNNE